MHTNILNQRLWLTERAQDLRKSTTPKSQLQNLPSECLLIIMAYLQRLDLMKLAATCKKFNSLVTNKFPTYPTLTFHHLHCGKNNHWYIMKHAHESTFTRIPAEIARLIAKWKFIRFEESKFTLKENAHLSRFLEPISHVWKNGDLTICAQSEVTEEFVRLVTTSKKLRLEINGVSTFLPQILSGSSRDISLTDASIEDDEIFQQFINLSINLARNVPLGNIATRLTVTANGVTKSVEMFGTG
ncbi:f-box-like domain-containing protein [Ditylenchus destructor]|nr:f-box-like domain-containing protein [Ditylenchus destructor]